MEDTQPALTLDWHGEEVEISRLEFGFDADYDNPLENVLIRIRDRFAVLRQIPENRGRGGESAGGNARQSSRHREH